MTKQHRNLSRRGLLASAATLGVASTATFGWKDAASAGGAVAVPPDLVQRVSDYVTARAQGANPGSKLAGKQIMSQSVLTYERERAAYMRSIGSRFDYAGRVINIAATAFSPQIAAIDAKTFQVSFYERMTMDWVPEPRPVPDPTDDELVQSQYGTPHILTLSRGTSGWSVVSDAYEERDLFGTSPDAAQLAPSTLNMITGQSQPGVVLPLSFAAAPTPSAALDPPYNVYARATAKDYAIQYALSYNASYVNYNCSGGDCANFVSQAFWAGGELPAGAWNRVTTSSCGVSNKYGGSAVQWYNNANLRAWAVNQARGATAGSAGALAGGDIINYDWAGGGTDHVAMMTKAAQLLVCCHNNDRQNVPWQLGGAQSYVFTAMFDHY